VINIPLNITISHFAYKVIEAVIGEEKVKSVVNAVSEYHPAKV